MTDEKSKRAGKREAYEHALSLVHVTRYSDGKGGFDMLQSIEPEGVVILRRALAALDNEENENGHA